MNNKLILTTCLSYPTLPEDLQPLVEQLSYSFSVAIQPWQSMERSDYILPLCAWDYAQFPQQFQQWLTQCSSQGSLFFNSPELMRWNMHKSYLLDLAQQGIEVIPSVYLEKVDDRSIQQVGVKQGWQEIVIKPAVGQSGQGVQKIRRNQPLVTGEFYQQGAILQPYIAEVATLGETSLIFFAGEFYHAVRRQPATSDWRTNSAFGATVHPQAVTSHIIQQAEQALLVLPEMPCYARVDGIIIGKQFLLNELELIEPALYLTQSAGAEARFLQALQASLGRRK